VFVHQQGTVGQAAGGAPAAARTGPGDQGEGATAQPLPPPLGCRPERRPYELILPSALVADLQEDDAEEGLATTDSPFLPLARLRGDLTHRLLEMVAHGRPLPSPSAVAAEVARVIADPEEALALAQEILTEVQACQADPFLAPLLAPTLPVAKSEWLVEAWTDLPSGRNEAVGAVWQGVYQSQGPFVYRGKIDRLVFDGRQWWLLDYKTSRPGPEQSWQEFEAVEVAKYRPQMEAYRAMAAKFFDLPDPSHLQTVLYFTAARRAVLL
jgi:ATP-dependent exoDNAse (exonuclease V) beta subunit